MIINAAKLFQGQDLDRIVVPEGSVLLVKAPEGMQIDQIAKYYENVMTSDSILDLEKHRISIIFCNAKGFDIQTLNHEQLRSVGLRRMTQEEIQACAKEDTSY